MKAVKSVKDFVNMYILKRPSCIKILLIIKQRKKLWIDRNWEINFLEKEWMSVGKDIKQRNLCVSLLRKIKIYH